MKTMCVMGIVAIVTLGDFGVWAQTAQEVAYSLVAKGRDGMQILAKEPTSLTKEEAKKWLDDVEAQVQEGLNGNQGMLTEKDLQKFLKDIRTEKERVLKKVRVVPPRVDPSKQQLVDAVMQGMQEGIEESAQKGHITREQADQFLGSAGKTKDESLEKGVVSKKKAQKALNEVEDAKEKALTQFREMASKSDAAGGGS